MIADETVDGACRCVLTFFRTAVTQPHLLPSFHQPCNFCVHCSFLFSGGVVCNRVMCIDSLKRPLITDPKILRHIITCERELQIIAAFGSIHIVCQRPAYKEIITEFTQPCLFFSISCITFVKAHQPFPADIYRDGKSSLAGKQSILDCFNDLIVVVIDSCTLSAPYRCTLYFVKKLVQINQIRIMRVDIPERIHSDFCNPAVINRTSRDNHTLEEHDNCQDPRQ